ncbi:MAG TPA: methyltransferase [Candidatus Avacidaminococcus intestinavium]|uniref:Methyltransferase n=1 Tax=Candidatus Avacidaminococcus intestinavium TaxID=2840684 RepID=A0A9D1MQW1_9FIRM|nr:methyltransferase [Candidatus Avacidaminococcus intestinavium]
MDLTSRKDSLPGCNYVLWQSAHEFCFTTDAVFLAQFPYLVRKARVLELGSGTGAISLLLAARGAEYIVGVDCNDTVVELMKRSINENNLQDRVSAAQCDLRNLRKYYAAESFDLVVANPPYRNSGRQRRIGQAACHEVTANLEDFFQAAAYAVKYRGRYALVQLPERFTECLQLAKKYGLELKRLQWLHSFAHKPAWAFLAEFVKGGSAGLEVLEPLIMYNNDGTYSAQTLNKYGLTKGEETGG